MRLVEVPELDEYADDLANLGVRDVVLRDVRGAGWLPVVVLEFPRLADGRARLTLVPWKLALRSSRGEAHRAVIEFLTGVAEARRAALRASPPSIDVTDERHRRRMWGVVEGIIDETDARRIGTASGSSAAPVELSNERRWASALRDARKAAGLTQVQLATRYGLRSREVSALERCLPNKVDRTVLRAIADDLGIGPPPDVVDDTVPSRS